jgi:hypothetical protein
MFIGTAVTEAPFHVRVSVWYTGQRIVRVLLVDSAPLENADAV